MDQRRNVFLEVPLVALVRIVGRPQNDVRPERARHQRQRRLADLGREEDVALAQVFARLSCAARRVVAFALLLLVHAIHHVRHPADAAFDAAELEIGEELKDAFPTRIEVTKTTAGSQIAVLN